MSGKDRYMVDFRSKLLKIGVSKRTEFRSFGAVFFFHSMFRIIRRFKLPGLVFRGLSGS